MHKRTINKSIVVFAKKGDFGATYGTSVKSVKLHYVQVPVLRIIMQKKNIIDLFLKEEIMSNTESHVV